MASESGPEVQLTVVMATRDRPRLLRDALESLDGALRSGHRVIVVDSASQDSSVGRIAGEMGATTVRCDRPGACRARNAGLACTETELVAFMDDDCLAEPDWSEAICEAFRRSSATHFITGRILPDSDIVGRAQLGVSLHVSDAPLTFRWGDDPKAMGHGANMAWRSASLRAIGGFDESMGPGAPFRAAEDHDVFWRGLRAGYVGRYEPGAVVRHRQWRNRREQLGAYYAYGIGTGAMEVKRSRLGDPPSCTGRHRPGGTGTHVLMGRLAAAHLASAMGNLARGYQMGAIADAAMLAGTAAGVARARRAPLVDGHFVPPAPVR